MQCLFNAYYPLPHILFENPVDSPRSKGYILYHCAPEKAFRRVIIQLYLKGDPYE